ncbi:MAG: caspase family protein [Crocinitomicaceae bacterium]
MKRFVIFLFAFVLNFGFAQEKSLETVLQKGHSKYVTCSDFHPSGKYAITGSYDNSIILWNLQSGKQIRIYNKHTAPVWSAVFSDDGSQILSTSADQSILLYNTLTGEIVHSWESPRDEVRQAYFSYSGNEIILSTNRDGLIIYDRNSGELIGEYYKNYAAAYQKGVISPDGLTVLNTSSYKGAEVFDLKTNDTLLSIPFDKVYGMEYSPDGSKIALSSSKQFAKIYDATTGKEIADLTDPDSDEKCDGCHTKQIWSHNSKYLVTMSNKIDAILWDAQSGKKIASLYSEKYRPHVMRFTPDDSHLVINVHNTIVVVNLKTKKVTFEYKHDNLDYFDIQISANSELLTLPGDNNTAVVYNLKTGRKQITLAGYLNHDRDDGLRYSYENWTDTGILKYVSMRRAFALDQTQEHVVIGSVDSIAQMINIKTGKVVQEFKGHSKVVLAFDFSPDGKTLATSGGDRDIIIWDISTGKAIEKLEGHRNLVFDLAYNSDGTKLVSASWDGTIGTWDLVKGGYYLKDLGGNAPYKVDFTPNDLYIVNGDLHNRLEFWESDAVESFRNLIGNTNIVGDFDFNEDGSMIVSACWDGKVKVWDVNSGMQVARLNEHKGSVYAVSWSKESNLIASAGADNKVVLWNPVNNTIVAELIGHTDAVTDLEFTDEGRKLISLSAEGQLKVWDVNNKSEDYSRIQISRNQWISTTPAGYFDGSSKALGIVNYVSGMDVVPVGSLFDKYFSPGLINRMNNGESFNDRGEINSYIESSPTLAFHLSETSKRSIPVDADSTYKWKRDRLPLSLEIDSQDEALEEVRIYNNGKLVVSEMFNEKLVFRGGAKNMKSYEIPLSDGDNLISGSVINKNRTESSPTKILVKFDGEAAKTDLYILSVGINEYKNPQYNLDYAVNDAGAFSKALVKGADSLFNEVFEYKINNSKATKLEIEKVLEELKEKIGPEDVFVFYYAGHGVMSLADDVGKQDFYIVTHDIVNLYGDQTMLDEKAVSARELMQYSVAISAEKQLFVLDACHSGGALESFATRGDGREKALAQLARSTGTFFLTASQDAQYANEVGDLKHGLFTYALLEVVEGSSDNGDHKVTVNEIKTYVEDRVPELSQEYRGSPQYPTSYSFGQDFPLVILK